MMTKTFWISLGTAALASAGVLLVQAGRNARMDEELADRQEELVALEREARNAETAVADSPLLRGLKPSPGSTEEAIAKTRAATTRTERIAGARSRLERLVADLGNINESPGGFFKVLPDILRVVQDLSLDELIAVADGMKGTPGATGEGSGDGVTRMILYLLAAEQDPLRVMANKELMKDMEMRQGILGSLARRDPEAALKWVQGSDMSEPEKREFTALLAMQVLRHDVDAGLKMIREVGGAGLRQGSPFGVGPVPKEQLPDLVAGMRNPENAEIREQVTGMVLATLMLDGGVKGAREQVALLGVPQEDVAAFLTGTPLLSGDSAEAEAILDWMREIQTPQQLGESLPRAIGEWANSDYNAAGEWLGKLEASPAKDIAVQRYVQVVSWVDPQAAAVWANSIDGEGARAVSMVFAAEQWLVKDKPAAEAWLAEKGIDLPALRERAGGAANPAVGPQATFEAPVRVKSE